MLSAQAKNIREFLWKLGEISPKNTILRRCYEKKIPVFCPAIADSGIGLMIWGQLVKNKKINIDAFDDLREIINISWGKLNKDAKFVDLRCDSTIALPLIIAALKDRI